MATATVLPPTPKLNQQFRGWVPRTQSNAVKRVLIRPSTAYTNFADALLAPNLLGSPSRKRMLTTSVIMHAILIGIPLLVSAWFTDTLDIRTYTRTLLVAPPAAAPEPTPPLAIAASQAVRPTHRVFTAQGKLFMPPAIPKHIAMLKEAPLPPEPEGIGVFGGVPGGVTGGAIGGLLEAVKAPEAPPVPPPQPSVEKTKSPVPVGGNVQPPKIIYRKNPDYPTLAHQAGIQGGGDHRCSDRQPRQGCGYEGRLWSAAAVHGRDEGARQVEVRTDLPEWRASTNQVERVRQVSHRVVAPRFVGLFAQSARGGNDEIPKDRRFNPCRTSCGLRNCQSGASSNARITGSDDTRPIQTWRARRNDRGSWDEWDAEPCDDPP